MLDELIHNAFDQMAGSDQPPARVSVAHAIRQARILRRRQRLTAAGAPVLAAGAALAVALSGALVSGVAGTRVTPTGPGSGIGSQRFNPLVPYATAKWYPYGISGVLGYAYPTALRLIPVPSRAGPWTSIVVYAANQCVLANSRLVCGAVVNGTRGVMTVSGRAPDVGRHAAYWIRDATGDLTPDIPPGVKMVAFRYARLAWAMVESSSTPADVLRIAANLRYGQTLPLRFPIQLTGLPRAWREVRQVEYFEDSRHVMLSLLFGTHPGTTASLPPGSLYLSVSLGKGFAPECGKTCQAKLINGYKVYLFKEPGSATSPPMYVMYVPIADGLNLQMAIPDRSVRLSLASIFGHDVRLLGPNPAHWTTRPIG
jgi:hypothetical protein